MGTLLKICFLVLHILLHCDNSVTKLTCKVVPLKARPSLKAKMIFSGAVLPTLNQAISSRVKRVNFGK